MYWEKQEVSFSYHILVLVKEKIRSDQYKVLKEKSKTEKNMEGDKLSVWLKIGCISKG